MKKEVAGKRKTLVLAVFVGMALLIVWGITRGKRGTPVGSGINLSVPGVHLKDDGAATKMAMYDRSAVDSLKFQDRVTRDSVLRRISGGELDSNELKVSRGLREVKEALKERPAVERGLAPSYPVYAPALPVANVDRLERLLRSMKEDSGPDPEMAELNKTLDKLVAVQRPVKVVDSGVRGAASSVVKFTETGSFSAGRWYGLDGGGVDTAHVGMIEAVVAESQTLVDGGVLKLELRSEVVVKGVRVPVGTIVYGEGHLQNERLRVKVSSVRVGDLVFPVAMEVVDLDGLAGIYEPGSSGRDAVRESAGQGVGMIGPSALDGSWGGQAANVGIQMARSLGSKKIRQVKATVLAGYRVFLEDVSRKL